MKSNTYADINKAAISSLTKNKEKWFFPTDFIPHIIHFFKKQIVLVIAIFAMLITCIFVPLDMEYLDYFN